MTRSAFAGSTDYARQTVDDIRADLRAWTRSLRDCRSAMAQLKQELHDSEPWRRLPDQLQILFAQAEQLFETAESEAQEIAAEVRRQIRPDHATRLTSLGRTAEQLNKDLGRAWNNRLEWSRSALVGPGDEEYRSIERVYMEARGMAADLEDLMNAGARLQDFVGRRKATIFHVAPELYGVGVDLPALGKWLAGLFRKRH